MTRVAVIGTGAIGTAVARKLLAAGHPVVVWNRTPERTAPLLAAGATPGTAADADLALFTMTDHAAVREHLTGDLTGKAVVSMCTGTAAEARETAALARALGAEYLDAGIQTAPEDIGTPAATILYSGSLPAFTRHRDVLALLSTPRHVGDRPDAAATWDLTLFGIWYDAQLGLLRALEAARDADIDLTEFATTAATQLGHVVTAAAATADEVRSGNHPAGPATLREHLTVVRHLIDLRSGSALGDGGLGEVASLVDGLVASGRGGDGLSAVVGPAPESVDGSACA
jgi:3-hydroxyisobutyrate dehydrogenase-like beta-hydroxyacid dehydrogenase